MVTRRSETSLVDLTGVSESDMTPECPSFNISKSDEVPISITH